MQAEENEPEHTADVPVFLHQL